MGPTSCNMQYIMNEDSYIYSWWGLLHQTRNSVNQAIFGAFLGRFVGLPEVGLLCPTHIKMYLQSIHFQTPHYIHPHRERKHILCTFSWHQIFPSIKIYIDMHTCVCVTIAFVFACFFFCLALVWQRKIFGSE